MDVLRSTLQPITHNLPPPIRSALLSLLGSTCYKTLILDIDPTPSPCLNLAISKSLGLGIVAASAVVKIPQILKLLSSQSAAGVSFLSYALETASFAASLAYNVRHQNPFSTYGETALIAVQNVVISVLVLRYQGQGAAAAVFVAAVAAAGYALLDENVVGSRALGYAQMGAGLLGVAAKAPQIWTVWKQGGTGQLSAFAVFNYLLGSLSRIFTTLQEVNDPLILYGFIAGFTLNLLLAAQMLYYWNSPATASHATELGDIKKEPRKLGAAPSTSTSTSTGSKTGSGYGSGSGIGTISSTGAAPAAPAGPRSRGPTTRRRG